MSTNMDHIDRCILDYLQKNGRISNLLLAERIRMSPPQTLNRIRKLEEKRIIYGYTAKVSPDAIGLGTAAYVNVLLIRDQQQSVRAIEEKFMAFPHIIECHKVSGNFDYILKVVAEDLKKMSHFLTDILLQIPGIASVRTSVCMEEIKHLTVLPLE